MKHVKINKKEREIEVKFPILKRTVWVMVGIPTSIFYTAGAGIIRLANIDLEIQNNYYEHRSYDATFSIPFFYLRVNIVRSEDLDSDIGIIAGVKKSLEEFENAERD